MPGLRTQESQKFKTFFEIIQSKAALEDKVFFLDCGEGRDFETDSMEGEDLCGWLVPLNMTTSFAKEWQDGVVSDRWLDFMTWAIWSEQNGRISVDFKDYG